MKNCDVREATHVKVNGQYELIVSKQGIRSDGSLARVSEGGFSVTTESGRTVSMWQAKAYGKADSDQE